MADEVEDIDELLRVKITGGGELGDDLLEEVIEQLIAEGAFVRDEQGRLLLGPNAAGTFGDWTVEVRHVGDVDDLFGDD